MNFSIQAATRSSKLIIFALLICCISSCSRSPEVSISFYYWKTGFKLNDLEAKTLRHFQSKKLYVRIMDLDWNAAIGAVAPVSPVNFSVRPDGSLEIVPVVFIVNNSLKGLSKEELNILARRIPVFVEAKLKQAGKQGFQEMQVDCDWSRSTMQNYFYLLKQIRSNLEKRQQRLSVTLRLHQYKNRGLGIPPANRVSLMCYNMGNLRQYGSQNSILEIPEMKKYLAGNNAYPLPMDIALGLFEWTVVFRSQKYIGISRINWSLLNRKDLFTEEASNSGLQQETEGSLKNLFGLLKATKATQKTKRIFIAKKELPEYGIRTGDYLRYETVTASDLQEAAELLRKHVQLQDSLSIIFYHLDANLIQKFTYEDLEKTVNTFR